MAAIKNPEHILIDTRTLTEYIGNPKQKRSGHIPSAILLPWDQVLDIKNGLKQKSDDELLEMFKRLGMDDKNKTYILYCNTAHRAARLWAAMLSQGYKKVKMYDASIQEWAANEFLPLKQGKQP